MARTPRILATIVALAMLVSSEAALAQSQLEQGFAAFERGDYTRSAKLIRPYAEQGDPEAQFKLGSMYQKGLGVAQDHKEAVKWYRLSADRGQPFAQNNLGVMYKNGWGVEQDLEQAYVWFSLAITYYFDFEEMNLERARQNRLSVSMKMAPDEIAAAQQQVKDWVPKPYSQGASTKLLAR